MLYCQAQITELNLWWEPRADFKKGYRYTLRLNGEVVGNTRRVFFDFVGLQPNTEYTMEMYVVDTKGRIKGERETIVYRTKPQPYKADVTKSPYFVKCDGVTDCTEIINKAIQQTDGILFFPKGEYVCEQMTINSKCHVEFEKGVVIRAVGGKND